MGNEQGNEREIEEFVESTEGAPVEGGIEFDEIDCCALDRAFEMNPEVTSQLKDIFNDDENFGTFRRILKGAKDGEGIKFSLEDRMNMICSQIAKLELQRMDAVEYDEKLSCDHPMRDHIDSLKDIVKKMEPTIH